MSTLAIRFARKSDADEATVAIEVIEETAGPVPGGRRP